jgi:chemotaxis protein MotA
MIFFVGISFFSAAVWLAAKHLNQPLQSYVDIVAFLVVFGGTITVSMIVLPWENWRDVLRGFGRLFALRPPNRRQLLRACLDVIANPSQEFNARAARISGLPAEVLRDGVELISLGFGPEKIEPILRERVFQFSRRAKRAANALKSIAKYPPAFGLVGTVLGLVNLMRAISAGMDAKETGVKMAVALVATLYGLMMANLIVNPAGELILKGAQADEELGEMALQAVLLAAERTSYLEAQELMNSFVDRRHRESALGQGSGSEAEAA